MERREPIEMTEQKEIRTEVFEKIELDGAIILYVRIPPNTKIEVGDKLVIEGISGMAAVE
jgi:hypothetical protein